MPRPQCRLHTIDDIFRLCGPTIIHTPSTVFRPKVMTFRIVVSFMIRVNVNNNNNNNNNNKL